MTEPVTIYRLKIAYTTGGSSWGDWKYFENREEFEEATFNALLSEHAHNHHGRSRDWIKSKNWRELVLKIVDEKKWVKNVFSAEQLVDGQWIELKPRLVPPRLEFDG